MAEEIEEKEEAGLSKKELKKLKKQQKAEAKKAKKAMNGENPEGEASDDDEGGGIIIALVAILILAVWLAIFALLIKMDVGGFGSTILYPVLKDVPVLNQILPETENDIKRKKDDAYNYASVSDAVDKIKELETQLKKANKKASDAEAKISDLSQQAAELQTYKEKEAQYEALKKKFDKEVVFSDKAPDIKEYKEYYESISPENAQAIYKEVLEQQQTSEEIKKYVAAYSAMKPAQAAGIFEKMTNNLSLVAKILKAMDSEARGKILGAMNAEVAAQVTQLMEP
jgi:flagellar motility protein MotE (MotC chaperone)